MEIPGFIGGKLVCEGSYDFESFDKFDNSESFISFKTLSNFKLITSADFHLA